MSDERFDEQVRRLRAGRDRLKALPAEPGRRDSLPAGDLYAGEQPYSQHDHSGYPPGGGVVRSHGHMSVPVDL
jgi:hypothetical protein